MQYILFMILIFLIAFIYNFGRHANFVTIKFLKIVTKNYSNWFKFRYCLEITVDQ